MDILHLAIWKLRKDLAFDLCIIRDYQTSTTHEQRVKMTSSIPTSETDV
jgi:hypothetical protein